MTLKPLTFLALKKAMISNETFIRKLARNRDVKNIRKVLKKATPTEILVLNSMIRAHVCLKQRIKMEKKCYDKIEKAKKVKYIKSNFCSEKKIESVEEARKLLQKIASLLPIFAQSAI